METYTRPKIGDGKRKERGLRASSCEGRSGFGKKKTRRRIRARANLASFVAWEGGGLARKVRRQVYTSRRDQGRVIWLTKKTEFPINRDENPSGVNAAIFKRQKSGIEKQ